MGDADEFADPEPAVRGQPLQIVQLNMEEKKAEVNEDALGRLEKRLRELGTHKVAVVSVMGAFRTGKSFLLDLFLRFLRYEEKNGAEPCADAPPRAEGNNFPLPAWMTSGSSCVDGAQESAGGFRFKGGMDACTEGIWVWSEPFIRTIKEGTETKKVALILMDTQGAWDGNMTKEQSATIFGLTAVLSSKQIYNINMQVQEDKVENLAFFMRFAQAALSKAASEHSSVSKEELDRPFQALDFLVRDWKYFRPEWNLEQCREQMQQHIDKFLNPAKVVENSTAEALNAMFKHISCFCMPHPGFAIERETWSGNVKDIDQDFVRFADTYIREVFTEGLDVKVILGQELSTLTFPIILRNFVGAFHDAAPQAMSFTQAMTSATVLLAREQSMKLYTKKMDEEMSKNSRGLDEDAFKALDATVQKLVKEEYERVTIFGSEATRAETWASIQENLSVLCKRYTEDNARQLEKALVVFANVALLGLCLFCLDRVSDFVCDWWLQTCVDLSRLMLVCYLSIFGYIALQVYLLGSESGKLSVAVASGEMWKEMMRLTAVYGELVQKMTASDLQDIAKQVFARFSAAASGTAPPPQGNSKKTD